jgi:hypothetical protein
MKMLPEVLPQTTTFSLDTIAVILIELEYMGEDNEVFKKIEEFDVYIEAITRLMAATKDTLPRYERLDFPLAAHTLMVQVCLQSAGIHLAVEDIGNVVAILKVWDFRNHKVLLKGAFEHKINMERIETVARGYNITDEMALAVILTDAFIRENRAWETVLLPEGAYDRHVAWRFDSNVTDGDVKRRNRLIHMLREEEYLNSVRPKEDSDA